MTTFVDANISQLDFAFMKRHAFDIVSSAAIGYIKDAKPSGSVFRDASEAEGSICTLFTRFYVDHAEPAAAWDRWIAKENKAWPLGMLPEGHEFLCILPNNAH